MSTAMNASEREKVSPLTPPTLPKEKTLALSRPATSSTRTKGGGGAAAAAKAPMRQYSGDESASASRHVSSPRCSVAAAGFHGTCSHASVPAPRCDAAPSWPPTLRTTARAAHSRRSCAHPPPLLLPPSSPPGRVAREPGMAPTPPSPSSVTAMRKMSAVTTPAGPPPPSLATLLRRWPSPPTMTPRPPPPPPPPPPSPPSRSTRTRTTRTSMKTRAPAEAAMAAATTTASERAMCTATRRGKPPTPICGVRLSKMLTPWRAASGEQPRRHSSTSTARMAGALAATAAAAAAASTPSLRCAAGAGLLFQALKQLDFGGAVQATDRVKPMVERPAGRDNSRRHVGAGIQAC